MAATEEYITIADFCARTGKDRRQVYRLYGIHAGLKQQVAGEKESRVNWPLWEKIISSPKGYVKLN